MRIDTNPALEPPTFLSGVFLPPFFLLNFSPFTKILSLFLANIANYSYLCPPKFKYLFIPDYGKDKVINKG